MSHQADVKATYENLRYHAGWADKYHGITVPIDEDYIGYTRLEPVGKINIKSFCEYKNLS